MTKGLPKKSDVIDKIVSKLDSITYYETLHDRAEAIYDVTKKMFTGTTEPVEIACNTVYQCIHSKKSMLIPLYRLNDDFDYECLLIGIVGKEIMEVVMPLKTIHSDYKATKKWLLIGENSFTIGDANIVDKQDDSKGRVFPENNYEFY